MTGGPPTNPMGDSPPDAAGRYDVEVGAADVLDAVPHILIILDKDGNVRGLNRAALALTDGRLILNLPCGDVIKCENVLAGHRCGWGPSCDKCPLRASIRRTITCGAVRDVDGELITIHDGVKTKRHVTVSSSLLSAGKDQLVLLSVLDTTAPHEAKEAVRRLRESDRKFRLLFENSPDGVFLTTADGSIHAANPAACSMLGYSESELCRLGRVGILDSEDPRLADAMKWRQSGPRVVGQELTAVRKAGEKFPVEITSVILSPEANESFVIMRDITERKRGEEQIQLLLQAFKFHPDAVYWLNSDFCFTHVNENGCRMLGYTSEELIGRPVSFVNPRATPERFGEVLRKLKDGSLFCVESIHRRKDGTEFPVEIVSTLVRLKDKEHICGFARDISDRKRVEAFIMAHQEMLAAIVESSPDAIFVLDRHYRYLSFNSNHARVMKALFGKDIRLGENILDYHINPVDRQIAKDNLDRVLRGESVNVEHLCGDDDFERRYFAVSHNPIRDHRGEVTGAAVYGRDLTSWKQATEAIARSEAALKKAQQVSHVGSWAWHIKSNQLEWSDETYRIFGLDKSSFSGDLGEVIARAIHPDDRSKVDEANLRVIQKHQATALEYRVLWPDGNVRTVWAEAGELILDDSGEPAILTGIVQDITDRKQSEAALQRLGHVFENAHWGMLIVEPETQIMRSVNSAFAQMHGYTVEEMSGRSLASAVAPEARGDLADQIRITEERGHNIYECVHLRKDGSRFPCRIHSTAFKDKTGKVLFRAGTFEDITERKRAEADARLQSEIARGVAEGIYLVAAKDLKIVYANPTMERMFGYAPGEMIGLPVATINAPSAGDPAETARQIEATLLREGHYRGDVLTLKKDGTTFWTQTTISKMHHPEYGDVYVSLQTDLTDRKRAQEALEQSESLLKQSQKVARLGHYVYDIANDRWSSSESLDEVFGIDSTYPRSKRSWLQLVHPEQRLEMEQFLSKRLLNKSDTFSREYRIRRGVDGAVRWVHDHARFEYDAEGCRTGLFGIVQDITERKLAEEVIRSNEEQYRSLVNNIGLGVVLIDDTYRIRSINPSLAKVFGKTPEAMIDTECFRAFEQRESICPHCPGKKAMTTGRPVEMERQGTISDNRHTLVRIQAFPIQDASGQSHSFIEIVEDIAQRREAENALLDIERDLESAQSQARIGFWRWNVQDDTATWSKGTFRIYERSDEDLKNHRLSFLDMVHPDDRQRVGQALNDAIDGRKEYDIEYRIPMPDGREKTIHAKAELVRDGDGQPFVLRGSIQDITERRLIENQYRQAQKMEAVGRLAAGVAHDFNNQLTVINGYSEMILANLRRKDPYWQPLTEIREAARRAQSTTNHLLSFSRKQSLDAEAFDVADFLTEAQKPISRMVGEDIRFVLAAAPGLPRVFVDRSGLHQALMNLVVNARDAMPGGGELTLRTSAFQLSDSRRDEFAEATPGDYVLLEVMDSGIGMDYQTLERVFDPFFTTKEPGKGTGLGLPMVMGFMQQSHGAVSIRTELGRGTNVRLLLPLAKISRMRKGRTSSVGRQNGGRSNMTILVVEDEESVRRFVVNVLKQAGYVVLEASGAKRALQMAKKHKGTIDLLITDMVMPDMKGDELARELTAAKQNMRVLLISGYAENKPVDKQAFLRKPFEMAALVAKVQSLLKNKTHRRKRGT